MPELPEVETVVRQLRREIVGRTFAGLRVFWPRTVEGRPHEFRRLIRGQAVRCVTRRGKYIGVECDGGAFFTVHLRMTGKLLRRLGAGDRPHLRAEFSFADGSRLYFVDARKFGRMRLWPCRGESCPGLGPEPLRPAAVRAALGGRRTKRPIKSVLLDQAVLAGIGNIYADEALFAAGIHPLRPLASLSAEEILRLGRCVPRILRAAIRRSGTTLRNYRTVAGESGGNQEHLFVYGRSGEPCFVCGAAIARIRINGRSSHFCPSCQCHGVEENATNSACSRKNARKGKN
jgi:formamidopyrimidine-DNA glycosylase